MDTGEYMMDIDEDNTELFDDEYEDIPIIMPRRNDVCYCGSGKKYKLCCLKQDPVPGNLRIESLQVCLEVLPPEDYQDGREPLPEEEEIVLNNLREMLWSHPEPIDFEDCNYFFTLNELKKKYPKYPIILNLLVSGFQIIGDEKKACELLYETRDKFPQYLFGKLGLANEYLNEGDLEKAFDMVSRCHSLRQLYPTRKRFHATEVRYFHFTLTRYFCLIGDVIMAERHIEILEGVVEFMGDDDSFAQLSRMHRLFNLAKLEHNARVILGRLTKKR